MNLSLLNRVRVYDNGGATADRYTAIFTGRFPGRRPCRTYFRGMSAAPYSPQGVGLWDDLPGYIDRPSHANLGRRVAVLSLPLQVQRSIREDLTDLWGCN